MATYSTGITAKFGTSDFAQVFDLSVPLYGAMRKDRSPNPFSAGWSDEVGTVSLSSYSSANMTTANYGVRDILTITGGGVSLTSPAVCIGVSATPELNGVTRYTFTAKLLDG